MRPHWYVDQSGDVNAPSIIDYYHYEVNVDVPMTAIQAAKAAAKAAQRAANRAAKQPDYAQRVATAKATKDTKAIVFDRREAAAKATRIKRIRTTGPTKTTYGQKPLKRSCPNDLRAAAHLLFSISIAK